MKICHCGHSEAVNRALIDFGIEESFASAAARFKEHYHYEIGQNAVARSTKNTASQAMEYIESKLSDIESDYQNRLPKGYLQKPHLIFTHLLFQSYRRETSGVDKLTTCGQLIAALQPPGG